MDKMLANREEDDERREIRKRKNRESAEKNRKEKDDTIDMLKDTISVLSRDIHNISVNNWSLRRFVQFDGHDIYEQFPVYTPPSEPAVF